MKAVKMLKDEGKIPSRMLTSDTQIQRMRKNKGIQSAIYGNINAGRLVTMNELRSIIMEEFGLQIATCDERYAYIKADGSRVNGRYFDEDKVTFYTADVSGRAGTGLWGPTPEEAEYAAFQEALQKMFGNRDHVGDRRTLLQNGRKLLVCLSRSFRTYMVW